MHTVDATGVDGNPEKGSLVLSEILNGETIVPRKRFEGEVRNNFFSGTGGALYFLARYREPDHYFQLIYGTLDKGYFSGPGANLLCTFKHDVSLQSPDGAEIDALLFPDALSALEAPDKLSLPALSTRCAVGANKLERGPNAHRRFLL